MNGTRSFVRCAAFAAVSGLSLHFASAAVLPQGYVRVETVTMPVTAEKPANCLVLPNVRWGDVGLIHARYAYGEQVSGNLYTMTFTDATATERESGLFIALGSGIYGFESGMTTTWIKPFANSFDVGEVVYSNMVCSTKFVDRTVAIGGHYNSISFDRTTIWYEVEIRNADGDLLAYLLPCTHEDKAGFYDFVTKQFLTCPNADWNAFTASAPLVETTESVLVTGSPAEIGTVTPAYGQSTVNRTGTTACSVALTTYPEDDVQAVAVGEGCRRAFDKCEILADGEVVETKTQPSFDLSLPQQGFIALQMRWSFSNEQYRVTATAGAGGTVSVDGGPACASGSVWKATNESVTLTATPAAERRLPAGRAIPRDWRAFRPRRSRFLRRARGR